MKTLLEGPVLPADHATLARRVVLRDKGEGQHHRYVTHVFTPIDGGHVWGHYFADLEKATSDFHERVRNLR